MPRPVPDINYALGGPSRHEFNASTYVDTITVPYAVGNKDASGAVVIYNVAGMPSPLANGSQVVYTAPVSDSRMTTVTNIIALIAAQEGLNLAAGDTVDLT